MCFCNPSIKTPFCGSDVCLAEAHKRNYKIKPREDEVLQAFRTLLQFVEEDPDREGLLETPMRMLKAWKFWTQGYQQDPKELFKTFEDGGEDYDQMLLLDPIPFFSMCEHHLAPFFGEVCIAYIPKKRIAGLSKFARLVDCFARRLQVQERLTTQLANTIQEILEPAGCGVFIRARHLCMESRGVQKPGGHTKTSALKGIFLTKPEVRQEFFAMVNGR